MTTTKITSQNAEIPTKTTTLTEVDRFGVTHFARVSWRPQHVEAHAGLSNVGKTLVAWDEEPPVGWVWDQGINTLLLEPRTRRVTGTEEVVIEGIAADDPDELEPGEFFVHDTWSKRGASQ